MFALAAVPASVEEAESSSVPASVVEGAAVPSTELAAAMATAALALAAVMAGAAIFVLAPAAAPEVAAVSALSPAAAPEAAAVSGISVFAVTLGAFIMAGILYGFGSWLECNRMIGSGSAAYGQGWDMDAIAACVVGGVSFTGGIGKISGVVTGVLIFTSLTYSLTILGIDTNLQFIFEGIIILAAVTLDCLKYVQKK